MVMTIKSSWRPTIRSTLNLKIWYLRYKLLSSYDRALLLMEINIVLEWPPPPSSLKFARFYSRLIFVVVHPLIREVTLIWTIMFTSQRFLFHFTILHAYIISNFGHDHCNLNNIPFWLSHLFFQPWFFVPRQTICIIF